MLILVHFAISCGRLVETVDFGGLGREAPFIVTIFTGVLAVVPKADHPTPPPNPSPNPNALG